MFHIGGRLPGETLTLQADERSLTSHLR